MSAPQHEAQQAYQTYTHLYQVASQLNAQAKVDPSKADAAQQANQQAHTAYAAYQAAWSKAYQEHNKQADVLTHPVATPAIAQPVVAQPTMAAAAMGFQQPAVATGLQVPAIAQPTAAAPTAQLSSTQLASLFPTAAASSPAMANPLAGLPGLGSLGASLPVPAAANPATPTSAGSAAANPMAALAALPGFQQLVSQQIQQATLQAALIAQGIKKEDTSLKKQGSKRPNPEPISHSKKQFPKADYSEGGHDDRDGYDTKKEWTGRPEGRRSGYQGNNYDPNYNERRSGNHGYENSSYDNSYNEGGTGSAANKSAATVDRFGNKLADEHGNGHFNKPAKDRLGARQFGSDPFTESGTAENKDYTAMSTDTVYVEGLPFDVDRSVISDFFSQVGPLRTTGQTAVNGIGRLFVFREEDDKNKCNGAASVTFQNAEDAENCCSLLQGKSFPVPKENYKNGSNRKRNDSSSSDDVLNRERSAMRSERSDSSDDDDDRDYKRRKRNSSSSNTGKQSNFVNDPTSTIQNANRNMQPLTAEDKLRPWIKFDNKDYWIMIGKLNIRMATLGERDPIGEKRQKMGLPHQNSEAAREFRASNPRGAYRGRGAYSARGGSDYYSRGSPRGRGSYERGGRAGYNNYTQRGGYSTRGSYRGGHDSYSTRGSYDSSRGGRGGFHKKEEDYETTDRFGNIVRGSYRGATARGGYARPDHHRETTTYNGGFARGRGRGGSREGY